MQKQDTGRRISRPNYQENDWERVGRTLRRFRMLRGMSQDRLATDMGIGQSALAHIEAGRKPLTDIRLALAAESLGIEQIEIMRPREEAAA